MAKHRILTEEERYEAARRWWQENGRYVIVGAVLGIGAVLGWRGWEAHKTEHAREAAEIFYELRELAAVEADEEAAADEAAAEAARDAAAEEAGDDWQADAGEDPLDEFAAADADEAGEADAAVAEVAATTAAALAAEGPGPDDALLESLRDRYANTPYAVMAHLEAARRDVVQEDLEAAAEKLRWAFENANYPGYAALAGLRLARVQLARARPDDAFFVLGEITALPEVEYMIEEARGDAHLQKGNLVEAAQAYWRAMRGAERPSDFLKMKFHSTGVELDDKGELKKSGVARVARREHAAP